MNRIETTKMVSGELTSLLVALSSVVLWVAFLVLVIKGEDWDRVRDVLIIAALFSIWSEVRE